MDLFVLESISSLLDPLRVVSLADRVWLIEVTAGIFSLLTLQEVASQNLTKEDTKIAPTDKELQNLALPRIETNFSDELREIDSTIEHRLHNAHQLRTALDTTPNLTTELREQLEFRATTEAAHAYVLSEAREDAISLYEAGEGVAASARIAQGWEDNAALYRERARDSHREALVELEKDGVCFKNYQTAVDVLEGGVVVAATVAATTAAVATAPVSVPAAIAIGAGTGAVVGATSEVSKVAINGKDAGDALTDAARGGVESAALAAGIVTGGVLVSHFAGPAVSTTTGLLVGAGVSSVVSGADEAVHIAVDGVTGDRHSTIGEDIGNVALASASGALGGVIGVGGGATRELGKNLVQKASVFVAEGVADGGVAFGEEALRMKLQGQNFSSENIQRALAHAALGTAIGEVGTIGRAAGRNTSDSLDPSHGQEMVTQASVVEAGATHDFDSVGGGSVNAGDFSATFSREDIPNEVIFSAENRAVIDTPPLVIEANARSGFGLRRNEAVDPRGRVDAVRVFLDQKQKDLELSLAEMEPYQTIRVGRNGLADAELPDGQVSEQHMRFVTDGVGRMYIMKGWSEQGPGPLNGIQLNGAPVHGNQAVRVVPGDRIGLGDNIEVVVPHLRVVATPQQTATDTPRMAIRTIEQIQDAQVYVGGDGVERAVSIRQLSDENYEIFDIARQRGTIVRREQIETRLSEENPRFLREINIQKSVVPLTDISDVERVTRYVGKNGVSHDVKIEVLDRDNELLRLEYLSGPNSGRVRTINFSEVTDRISSEQPQFFIDVRTTPEVRSQSPIAQLSELPKRAMYVNGSEQEPVIFSRTADGGYSMKVLAGARAGAERIYSVAGMEELLRSGKIQATDLERLRLLR